MDPAAFHPDPSDKSAIAAAKAVCARCPVKAECREHAIAANERLGVWGGVQAQSLKKARALRRRGQMHACAWCTRTFKPRNRTILTCSPLCSRRYGTKRKSEWQRKNRSGRLLEEGHGTVYRYKKRGCRCPACRTAQAVYRRSHRLAAHQMQEGDDAAVQPTIAGRAVDSDEWVLWAPRHAKVA